MLKFFEKERLPFINGSKVRNMVITSPYVTLLSSNLSKKYLYSQDELLDYFIELILNNTVTISDTLLLNDIPDELLNSVSMIIIEH